MSFQADSDDKDSGNSNYYMYMKCPSIRLPRNSQKMAHTKDNQNYITWHLARVERGELSGQLQLQI